MDDTPKTRKAYNRRKAPKWNASLRFGAFLVFVCFFKITP